MKIIETTRRLMLTAILSVCGPGSSAQGFMSILLSTMYIKLYAAYTPYDADSNSVIAEIGQYQIFFTFWAALVMHYNGLGSDMNELVGTCLLIFNLGVPYYFMYYEAKEWIREQRILQEEENHRKKGNVGVENENRTENNTLATAMEKYKAAYRRRSSAMVIQEKRISINVDDNITTIQNINEDLCRDTDSSYTGDIELQSTK